MRFVEQVQGMRPDKTVLLSASAGSGKTFVLVGRLLHLLAAGASPESLAAITFTEKAAAQMKDKLFGKLAEAAWDGVDAQAALGLVPADMPYPMKYTPEEVFSALVAEPDALRISTIHAFCLGLLRRFPLEAGLPAEFGLLDDTESVIRKERAVESAIEDAAADKDDVGRAFQTLLRSGMTVDGITELVTEALGKRGLLSMAESRAGGFERFIGSLSSASAPGEKEQAARDIVDGGEIAESAGRLLDMVTGLGVDLPKYTPALERLAALRRFADFPDTFGRAKGAFYTKDMGFLSRLPVSKAVVEKALKQQAGGGGLKERAAAFKDEHDAQYTELRERVNYLAALHDDFTASRALMALLRLYKVAEESYRSGNHREGSVDFDDLEVHAYRLLAGPDGHRVIEGLGTKVLHYLVDEFQDTNTLQWGIVERLSSEVFSGAGAEGAASPTLFAVGDTKQSIYRFRDADYHLMDALRLKMVAQVSPDRLVTPALDLNFRSAPEVLQVVDETFGVLIPDYRKSKPVRTDAKGGVTLRVVYKDDEAAALAESVENSVGLPIWDDAAGCFGPAGYGDMAVLLRSRSGLGAYESALRARAIPFKVVGGVGFFRQPEVRAVMGILAWLDNPGDRLSLVSALKSPLFRLSDGELEPLYKADDPLAALEAVSPEAQALFSGWRGRAGLVPVGSLVSDIIRDASALLAFGVSGGPAAALNIEKLLGLAHAFDMRGGVGLSEFTEWVAEYRERSDLPTADVELPGFERSVSIMTVHAAKGLEFPVVFLPGAARGTRNTSPGLLIGAGEGGSLDMAVKTDALLGDNPRYAALKESEKEESLGETARLLYVAMTRARDHLYIIAAGKPGKDGSFKPKEGTWASMLFRAAPQSLFGGGAELGEMPAVYIYPGKQETPPASASCDRHGHAVNEMEESPPASASCNRQGHAVNEMEETPPAQASRNKQGHAVNEMEESPPAPLPPSPAGGEGEERELQRRVEKDYPPPLAGGDEGEGEGVDYSRLAARLAPLPEETGVTFCSPSGLGGGRLRESAATDIDAPGIEPADRESAGLPAHDAVSRGLLIHAALERFGSTGRYDLAELARRIPAMQSLTKGEAAALVSGVDRTLASLLADEEISRLLAPGPGKHFELPLMMRRGSMIIGGSADLVVVDGDAAKVVDYKTGMADMTVDDIRETCSPQLEAYRDAVREAFGKKDVTAYLLLVDRVELVPVILA